MLFAPFRWAFRIVRLVLVAAVLYYGVTLVQVVLTSHENDPHRADAAIVFGTAAGYDTPGTDLRGRLERALALFEARDVTLIAVTGGKREGDVYTEAQISEMWLQAHGVPGRDVVAGGGSDTWQNVSSVAGSLRARHVVSLLVVTDPFHEYRAMAICSDFGFSPSAVPSQHSPIGGTSLAGHYLQEAAEVSLARIVGYGTISSWVHG